MFTVWARTFMIASQQSSADPARWDAPTHWRRPEPPRKSKDVRVD